MYKVIGSLSTFQESESILPFMKYVRPISFDSKVDFVVISKWYATLLISTVGSSCS